LWLSKTAAPRDKTFLRAAEKLLTSLKRHVKGDQGSVRMVTLQTLAQNAGLSESWIHNVVESNLIEALYNRHGPTWVHGSEWTAIHVPITVGTEL
jgi:DNA-directed RNA polymerase specialized sigma54-like protein